MGKIGDFFYNSDFLNSAELAKKLEGARVSGVVAAKEGSLLENADMGVVLLMSCRDGDLVEVYCSGVHHVLGEDEDEDTRFEEIVSAAS